MQANKNAWDEMQILHSYVNFTSFKILDKTVSTFSIKFEEVNAAVILSEIKWSLASYLFHF